MKSKKEYYTEYFEENRNNSKKVWEGIRSIVNINKMKSNCINQLNVNGDIIDNPKEIVESFNNFFVNVGPNNKIVKINSINSKPNQGINKKNKIPVSGTEGTAFNVRWVPNHYMEHRPFGFVGDYHIVVTLSIPQVRVYLHIVKISSL